MHIYICRSNLQRAKHTAFHTLQSHFDEAEELSLLQEASKYEHVFSSTLLCRIHDFEQWLSHVEESTIVIFGHAQYFKHMLKHTSNMHNCDVWKTAITFTDDTTTEAHSQAVATVTAKWGKPELHFRSAFSYQHPMNRFSFIYSDSSADTPAAAAKRSDDSEVVTSNNLKKNEPNDEHDENGEDAVTCRICQMTASESTPGDIFIQPCHCTGTLSHVHISCLNEWRATSSTAAFKCYVCHYSYRIERTSLSRFLMSENGTNVISILLISLATLCMGVGGVYTSKHLLKVDICWEICRVAQWPMWWRDCSFKRLTASLYTFGNFWTKLLFHRDVEDIRAIFLCHPLMVLATEVCIVGCALLGTIGLMLFILNEGYVIYQAFGHGHQDWQHLAGIGCWLASLGTANMGRLSIWLGFAVSCRAAYYKIRTVGKKVAQTIGENILEPNRA